MAKTQRAKEKEVTGVEAGQGLGDGHGNLDATALQEFSAGLPQQIDVGTNYDRFKDLRARVFCRRDIGLSNLQRRTMDRYKITTLSESGQPDFVMVCEYEMTLWQLHRWLAERASRDPPEELIEIRPLEQGAGATL